MTAAARQADTMAEAADRLRADEAAYRQDMARLRREIARTREAIDAGRTPPAAWAPRRAPLVDWWPTWGPAPGRWVEAAARSVLWSAWVRADRSVRHRGPLVAAWWAGAVVAAAVSVAAVVASVAAWAPVWLAARVVSARRRRKAARADAVAMAAWANYGAWQAGDWGPAMSAGRRVRLSLFGWAVVAVLVALAYVIVFAGLLQHAAGRIADQREREAVTVTAGGEQP